ncbi:MAG: hypothetical protein FJ280_25205 [Planctomycetes bacterium]|nr:hypothetical protein [Planctomycetota bacterium]
MTSTGQENPDVEPGGADGLFDPVRGLDPLGDRLVPPPHEMVTEDLEYPDRIGRILNLLEKAIEGSVVPRPEPTEPSEPVIDEGWGYKCPPWSSTPLEAGPEEPGTIRVVPVHEGLLPPQAHRPGLRGGAGVRRSGNAADSAEIQWCPVRKEIVTVSDQPCKDCQYYEPSRADGDGACRYYAEAEET